MFTCDICNYSTDRSHDLTKHNASKKHIVNVNKSDNETNNIDHDLLNVTKCNQNVTPSYKKLAKTCHQIDNPEIIFVKNNAKKIQTCHQIDNFDICKSYNGLHEKKLTKKKSNLAKSNDNRIDNLIDELSELESDNDNTKRYMCECSKVYSHRQNLWKHRQKCTYQTNSLEIIKLKNEILELKTNNVKLQEENLALKKEKLELIKSFQCGQTIMDSQNTYTTTTNSNNTVNNNQKFISVFNYVSSNYNDAPVIKMLDTKAVKNLLVIKEDTKYSIEDHLIYHYKKHSLDDFLGEIIKNAYQKDDPEEQQFWTTNVAKLTFMVRKILDIKEFWVKDMQGADISKNIINPILKEIKNMLQKYIKCNINNDLTFDELERLQNYKDSALKLIKDINEKKIQRKILNYIAPYFQLQHQHKKNLIIYEEEDDE